MPASHLLRLSLVASIVLPLVISLANGVLTPTMIAYSTFSTQGDQIIENRSSKSVVSVETNSLVHSNLINKRNQENQLSADLVNQTESNSVLVKLIDQQWQTYKFQNGKVYSDPTEDSYRKGLYLQKRVEVATHNKRFFEGLETYDKKVNIFSDKVRNI